MLDQPMPAVGVRVQVHLDRPCTYYHEEVNHGRIGIIAGVVTQAALAADNATAIDPRDLLALESFGDHIYSVVFEDAPHDDIELCSKDELKPPPT